MPAMYLLYFRRINNDRIHIFVAKYLFLLDVLGWMCKHVDAVFRDCFCLKIQKSWRYFVRWAWAWVRVWCTSISMSMNINMSPPPTDNVWAEGSWSSAHRGRCEKVSILQPFAIRLLDRQGNGLIAWRAKNIVAMAGKVYKSKKRIKFTVSRRKSMAFYHVWYCCRPKQETDCTRPHWRGVTERGNYEMTKRRRLYVLAPWRVPKRHACWSKFRLIITKGL